MKKETLRLANDLDNQIGNMKRALKILSSSNLSDDLIVECLYGCRSLGGDEYAELLSLIKDIIKSKINILVVEKEDKFNKL